MNWAEIRALRTRDMDSHRILEQISRGGAWLPLVTVRQAFNDRAALTPPLLDAVQRRARSNTSIDIQLQRLAAFGVFFLAQHRERQLLGPLIELLELVDPEDQDEWLFSGRLFFFSGRLIAGICPADAQIPMELVLDTKLRPSTRAFALCAIGQQAAFGDVSRAEAVARIRELFKIVRSSRDELMDSCWVRTAAKVHSEALERELHWFLGSQRLDLHSRSIIARAIEQGPDINFLSILALEPMVDIFSNIFPREIRDKEVGLLPNAQIPGLELFMESEPAPISN